MLKGTVDIIKNLLFKRQLAYKAVFSGVNGEIVLEDLARFCHSTETCFNSDPRIHAVIEGRREVFLRICKNLNLTSEELWKLYGKGIE